MNPIVKIEIVYAPVTGKGQEIKITRKDGVTRSYKYCPSFASCINRLTFTWSVDYFKDNIVLDR